MVCFDPSKEPTKHPIRKIPDYFPDNREFARRDGTERRLPQR
jgi:hypothetical protein